MNFELEGILQPLISVYRQANIGANYEEHLSLAYGALHSAIDELGELIGDTESSQVLLDGMGELSSGNE